ncbi:hypothetical protein FA13DRAFT_1738741 [Coprinellus micaceus]|uniref:PLC-like phosphodiesterase n=1 Tax=Coprinellus micaceus TaxID=71717 RepID=A0A4Y7SV33_COPMI|nr:hypothetical protein FA13DRAFT_1738741 [Coprinellus micaceus]
MQGELPTKASGLRKWRTACLMVTILIALLLTLRLAVDSSFTTIGMLREGGVTTGNLMASPEGRESSSSLLADTGLRGDPHQRIPPAHFFRCQQSSIFQMLNDGIRVFDLRYAYNPGNDTIGFYHSRALLAPTTTLIDDERIQEMVLDIFSKPTNEDTLVNKMKRRFWIQKRGEVPRLHGLDLGADRWTDNGDDIHLVYNPESGATAFIEDRYAITLPPSATPSTDAYISTKFNATTTHLEKAAGPDAQTADQLFITFASAAFLQDPTEGFYMYPRLYAVGEGNTPGMNERLLHYFEQRKGQRFGVIMLDFYDAVPGLVETILGA